MNKKAVIVVSVAFLAFGYGAQGALEGVAFPVAELGNCSSREACKAYCDAPDHMVACTQFAQKNKLVSSEQVRRVEKFVAILKSGGPGSCRTPETCKSYCAEPEHRTECVSYAQRTGLVPSLSASPSPRTTPRQIERPALPLSPVASPQSERNAEELRPGIPREFLNGGATNLPPVPEQPATLKQSRSFVSSLASLVLRLFLIGGGIGQ